MIVEALAYRIIDDGLYLGLGAILASDHLRHTDGLHRVDRCPRVAAPLEGYMRAAYRIGREKESGPRGRKACAMPLTYLEGYAIRRPAFWPPSGRHLEPRGG